MAVVRGYKVPVLLDDLDERLNLHLIERADSGTVCCMWTQHDNITATTGAAHLVE